MNEKQGQEQVPLSETSGAAGLLDAVMEIGKERARILEAMKEALVRGDDAEALEYARELTGLSRQRVSPSRLPEVR